MTPALTTSDIVGIWLAAFFTLSIFSFLYKDNPFYKLAEHVFVGVSAGYWMVLSFWQTIMPNLVLNLQKQKWDYLCPLILGVMLLARLLPKGGWISRWPVAFCVGVFAGQNIVYTLQAQVLTQLDASIVPLWSSAAFPLSWLDVVINWIVFVGVVTGLLYFYFSVEHKGVVFGTASVLGIRILMIAFGAAFGYTVMARTSLLIGRMMFLLYDWWPVAKHGFSQ